MTIKSQLKNISAEKDYIVVNASLNSSTGVLTLIRENLYDDEFNENKNVNLDLGSIKLRIKKLESEEELETIKNSTDSKIIAEKQTRLYLVPYVSPEGDNKEGIYKEYIWSSDKNDFEALGSTEIDLDPIRQDIIDLETILDIRDIEDEKFSLRLERIEVKISELERLKVNISDIQNNLTSNTNADKQKPLSAYQGYELDQKKVDKAQGATNKNLNVVTDNSGNISLEAKYVHPAYSEQSGKPTQNLEPGFGDTVTISQIVRDNTGHISQFNDKTIKIPNSLGNGTKAGLTINDYTTTEKNKLNNIESNANKTITEDALNSNSTNPVQNKVITKKFADMKDYIDESFNQLAELGDGLDEIILNLNTGYVKIDDIQDNLSSDTEADRDRPLSAYQGYILQTSKLDINSIKDDLETSDSTLALSAKQGYALDQKKADKEYIAEILTEFQNKLV